MDIVSHETPDMWEFAVLEHLTIMWSSSSCMALIGRRLRRGEVGDCFICYRRTHAPRTELPCSRREVINRSRWPSTACTVAMSCNYAYEHFANSRAERYGSGYYS